MRELFAVVVYFPLLPLSDCSFIKCVIMKKMLKKIVTFCYLPRLIRLIKVLCYDTKIVSEFAEEAILASC